MIILNIHLAGTVPFVAMLWILNIIPNSDPVTPISLNVRIEEIMKVFEATDFFTLCL